MSGIDFEQQQQRTDELTQEADRLLYSVQYRQRTGSPYKHRQHPLAYTEVYAPVKPPMLWHVAERFDEEPARSDAISRQGLTPCRRDGYRHTPYAHDKWDAQGNRVSGLN